MTTECGTPAVIYAAKSTEDTRGSIDAQLADCRQLAQREGWNVVAEFRDEGFSAFHGNRGPGLARAKEALKQHAPSILVVQHTDRLARGAGDEPGAADHLMELFFGLGRARVELWAVQSGKVDRIRALLEGERNTEDSKRKSAATRDGLKRRRERGKPVGAMPLGYSAEKRVEGETVFTRRVVDPIKRETVERIFHLIEAGHSPGAVARALNREGFLTKRGKTWTARPVRGIVRNDVYAGRRGYPSIIDGDRWQAINDGLARMDPAAIQRRKGGRPPETDDYLLRGVAFCGRCGHSLYTRRHASGRHYICGSVREARGTCDAPAIPARLAEAQVLNHLRSFTVNIEQWLHEQAGLVDAEREQTTQAIERQRVELKGLLSVRERARRRWRDEEDDDLARFALEGLRRVEADYAALEKRIGDVEAAASEWAPVALDDGLDLFNRLRDLVDGKIRQARGASELSSALHRLLQGIWFDLVTEDDRLLAEFELRAPAETFMPDGERPSLPPMPTWRRALIDPLEVQSNDADLSSPTADAFWDALIAEADTAQASAKLAPIPSCTSIRSARRSHGRNSPRP